jgi:hypothetical protein
MGLDSRAKLWYVFSLLLPAHFNQSQVCCDERIVVHWYEIWYLSIFRKSVKKTKVQLKSDNNNGHFN